MYIKHLSSNKLADFASGKIIEQQGDCAIKLANAFKGTTRRACAFDVSVPDEMELGNIIEYHYRAEFTDYGCKIYNLTTQGSKIYDREYIKFVYGELKSVNQELAKEYKKAYNAEIEARKQAEIKAETEKISAKYEEQILR